MAAFGIGYSGDSVCCGENVIEPGYFMLVWHDWHPTVCKKLGEPGFPLLLLPLMKVSWRRVYLSLNLWDWRTVSKYQVPFLQDLSCGPWERCSSSEYKEYDMTHKTKTGVDSEKECIYSHPKSKPLWRWYRLWGNHQITILHRIS